LDIKALTWNLKKW